MLILNHVREARNRIKNSLERHGDAGRITQCLNEWIRVQWIPAGGTVPYGDIAEEESWLLSAYQPGGPRVQEIVSQKEFEEDEDKALDKLYTNFVAAVYLTQRSASDDLRIAYKKDKHWRNIFNDLPEVEDD